MIATETERISGPAGTAHRLTFTDHSIVDLTAIVDTWAMHCPGQSSGWSWYLLSCSHLRPIDGQREEPFLEFPDATHQVWLVAYQDGFDPVQRSTWKPLRPENYVGQVSLPSDDAAREIMEVAANLVIYGQWWAEPLLSGMQEPWKGGLDMLARRTWDNVS